MTWWMILLLIAGLIALLLSFSVSIHLSYRDETFVVKLSVLGIRFRLYPRKAAKDAERLERDEEKALEKQKKKKQKQKKKTSKQGADEKKSSPGVKETISAGLTLAKSVFQPAKWMLRHVRVTGVDVTVVAGAEEPDRTAILYGELCASVYGGAAALANLVTLKVKNLTVGYNFQQDHTTVAAFGKVKLRGFVAVAAGIRMIWSFMVNTYKKTMEQAPAERTTSPART